MRLLESCGELRLGTTREEIESSCDISLVFSLKLKCEVELAAGPREASKRLLHSGAVGFSGSDCAEEPSVAQSSSIMISFSWPSECL